MPWNGAGIFNRVYSWVADAAAGLDILASRMDTDTDDITSNGFGNTLTRDGQGSATANLPMNGNRHTGVGNGVARNDYAALGQLEDGLINWAGAAGTSDAIVAAYTPAMTVLADGEWFFFRATAANATSTPTFAPNGLGPFTITKQGGVALAAGDIPGNLAECVLRYNLADTRFELLNPASGASVTGRFWVPAGGTSDVITATYSPPMTALVDGELCYLRASAANATTTPTFAPNGLAAEVITKLGGTALLVGDIPGALAEIILRYNLAFTRWELLNPPPQPAPVTQPQGRMTPTSGVPVISADVIGATSIFYTPYTGNQFPVWTGAAFQNVTFAELSLALAAGSQTADGLFDVFGFLNAGVAAVAFGPAWAAGTGGNQTAGGGACVRGTGSGGTALARKNGILTNAAALAAANNGATTYAIPQNQGTYLGTVYIDHTAGQVTCHVSFGQNRKFGVWNYYNREAITLQAGDATASWTYASATIRASNANPTGAFSGAAFNVGSGTACNGVSTLCGVAEEIIDSRFVQQVEPSGTSGNTCKLVNGIGLNSITAYSGTQGIVGGLGASSNLTLFGNAVAKFVAPPTAAVLGVATLAQLEAAPTTVGGTLFGTQPDMALMVSYRG